MPHAHGVDAMTALRTARRRMATRRDRFVVGYLKPGNVAYGSDRCKDGYGPWTDPLSFASAKQLLAQMDDGQAAIFELVPVEVTRGR